jgi:PPOX class probable F420-dependent enzyme
MPMSIALPSSLYAGLALTLEQLPEWAIGMLEAGRVARLAYLDEADRPRVLPITYALLGGEVWSAIDDKPKSAAEPARLRYLRRRPEAALVVDAYDDDWSRLAWVQLLGSVSVVEAPDAPTAMDVLAAKYDAYAAARPPGPLLRLVPERGLCWRASG